MGVKEDEKLLEKEETKYEQISIEEESSLSEEEKEEKNQTIYKMNEMLDVLDKDGIWLNGEVVSMKNNEIRIHFTGFSNKFDEWIDYKSKRLQKQWKKGDFFQKNNRLDVFIQETGFWVEGRVIDIGFSHIKILLPSEKKEIFIEKSSDNISEIGSFSESFGSGKKLNKMKSIQNKIIFDENRFKSELASKGLTIKLMEGDGNCLFRAISDQIYGDQKYYHMIRKICMDYIEIEQDFYSNYVNEDFHDYLARKRQDGIWGDDVEIQAISEIYNKSIEIYAYSNKPMRTFHEKSSFINQPIRLSFHGKSHYNSIIRMNFHEDNKEIFGKIEENALKNAKSRISRSKTTIPEEIEKIILLSRTEFETKGRRDMETALEESLLLFKEKEKELQEKLFLEETIKISKEFHESELKKTKQYEYNTTINKVVNEGFPLEIVLQAYSIIGDDFDSLIKFIYENLI